jgi:hypothetical protein
VFSGGQHRRADAQRPDAGNKKAAEHTAGEMRFEHEQ